jgi:hypothetical protein
MAFLLGFSGANLVRDLPEDHAIKRYLFMLIYVNIGIDGGAIHI